MQRGQFVKCIGLHDELSSTYLTVGKEYEVTAGKGDEDMFGTVIHSKQGFQLIDDEGAEIYQDALCGLHGDFEVVK